MMVDSTVQTNPANASPLFADEAGVNDYLQLLKPRVMSLVIFTALVGMLVAPGDVNPVLAMVSVLAIAVGAGASAALNMWYDADIDRIMSRTENRPIPAGRVRARDALAMGLMLSIFSVTLLWLAAGVVAALLLAITIFFYAVIYTMWLKRRTPQNIVIGGAAGAFPPMIGWAAVTNSVTLESMILFALIFFWTPPHFWALSLFVGTDYSRANVPMLPQVAGEKVTRNQSLIYAMVLAPIAVAPAFIGMSTWVYGGIAAVASLFFVWHAVAMWRGKEGAEKKLFLYSIVYLFLLFAVLAVDVVLLKGMML